MARNELAVRGGRDHDEDQGAKRHRNTFADYLRPWLAAPALIPAGFLTHWMWGDLGLGTGLAAAAIAAAGGVVTYAAHKLTGARTWYAHHISTAMTGGAAAWLALATAFGPGRPLMDALLIGGWAAAAISNVHLWARAQGAADGAAPKWTRPSWAQVADKLGLRGVRMRVTRETDTITTGRLEFADGRTVEDVQHRRKELASMYRVAPGAVRITEHPERADWGEITIITKNVMKELIPWPGLDSKLLGASLADAPVGPMGVYEDGTLFVDELDDRHTLTVGMSGSGKSVYGKIKLVSIAARRDTFVCAIDMSKGRQTLGPVDAALGWTAFDKTSAKAMLAAIKRAVTARADYLGSKGLPGWTKDCGLSFLHILMEEAADLVDFDELVELGRAARSAGIHLEVSLQRATFGNIDTDARANFGDSISFGVKTDADAGFALPDYVLDAGAEPQRWMANQPGSAYAAVRHADVDRHAMPVKMYGPPTTNKSDENTDLTPAAESLPDQDAKLDPITRKAFGGAYAEFLAARVDDAAAVTADDTDEIEDQDHDDTEDLTVDEDIEPFVFTTPDDDPEIEGDLDTEIPPLDPEDDFALPNRKKGTKASAEEARAALTAVLDEWGTGKRFTVFDLKTELADMGVERRKTWFYDHLRRLGESGRLHHEDDGSWTILETRELIDA